MSATRLLVLGAVRILQPVHGYDVRRELLTWRLEEWTNIKPGSIYSALKTLQRDGCIAVSGQSREEGRPERTEFVMTAEGEKEFQLLLRAAWWTADRPAEPLIPALCLMLHMPREELMAALQARIGYLEGQLTQLRYLRGSIVDGATGADGQIPEHVREIMDFALSRIRSELDWTRTMLRRLKAGTYRFEGEPGSLKPVDVSTQA